MVLTNRMWEDVASALDHAESESMIFDFATEGYVKPSTMHQDKELPGLRWNYEDEQFEQVEWWEQDFPLKPRAFQFKGIRTMSRKKRLINRDKMGLGKTLQAAYAARGRTLVVCPNYLTEQWFYWLRGKKRGVDAHEPFAPYGRRRIVWCRGNFHQKLERLQRENVDFHIINMESFQTHADQIQELAKAGHWRTLIVDEAHHFRNKDTKRGETVIEVARNVEYVFPLTGSPIWKEVDDLFMLFRMIQPEVFTSYYDFIDNFCIADEGRFGTRVMGAKRDQIPELERLLEVMSIGRSYEEAGRELPPVIAKYIGVEFPKEIKDAYLQMCATFRMQLLGEDIRFDNFSQIMRTMRLMTAFPGKHEAAISIMEDVHDEDHGTLIFTWYRETCEAAAKAIGGVAIHGGSGTPEERRALALSSTKVVATISSLSEGIDLSRFRVVIFLEEHYTPGSIEQAIARVVRERQDGNNSEPVLLYYVHVKDSIDEAIHAVSKRRGGSIKEVLGEALHIW